MAYKFQLGAFVASGSILAEEGLDAGTNGLADAGAIAGATTISASSDVNIGGDLNMDTGTLSAAEIIPGAAGIDLSNIAVAAATVSADSFLFMDADDNYAKVRTMANLASDMAGGGIAADAGVFSLDLNELSAANINVGSDSIVFIDADGDASRKESIVDFATALAGGGLDSSSPGSLNVNVSGAIVIKSDKVALSSSIAGTGLGLAPGDLSSGIASSLELDILGLSALGSATVAQTDMLALHDDGAGVKSVTFSNLEDSIFGNVSGDATIAAGGALTIEAGAVENAMLVNDSVTLNAGAGMAAIGEVALGASVTVAVDGVLEDLDSLGAASADGEFIVATGAGAFAYESGNTARTSLGLGTGDSPQFTGLTLTGDLIVQGSTTTIDSTTINISQSFTFEGPADDNETVLHAGSPAADTTVYLPTLSAGNYYLPALADAATDASAAVTAAEFALLDGGSSIGTTALASGDGFLHNDNGVMKHTSINKIGDYLQADGLVADVNGKLGLDVNGLPLSKTSAVQDDIFAIVDSESGDVTKKITFSNLEDQMFANVSGDATIAAGGALTIAADAVQASMLNDDCISGFDDIGADIVDTDEMLISDAGVLKRTDMSRVATYIGNNLAVNVQNIDDAGTLQVGVNYFSTHGGAESVTLPASPAVGQSVKIKAAGDCSTTNTVTINRAGSQTIDGAASIVLESPYAAVELVYVASDLWRVF